MFRKRVPGVGSLIGVVSNPCYHIILVCLLYLFSKTCFNSILILAVFLSFIVSLKIKLRRDRPTI